MTEFDITNELANLGLQAGVLIANKLKVKPSSTKLLTAIEELCATRSNQTFPPPDLKKAVRDLLRKGGFKPAGRNKPASEYLAGAAKKQVFPIINNLVDINNLISLQTGMPISMLQLTAFDGGMRIRHGREDEAYVFNRTGQEIKLNGLICCCNKTSDQPLGNPVKDSMSGKIDESITGVVSIIYTPKDYVSAAELEQTLAEFTTWVSSETDAESVETLIC